MIDYYSGLTIYWLFVRSVEIHFAYYPSTAGKKCVGVRVSQAAGAAADERGVDQQRVACHDGVYPLTPSDDLSYYKFNTQLDNAKQSNLLSRKQ
jgi:hypothetical protein